MTDPAQPSSPPKPVFYWTSEERRLRSGDCILILTDIHCDSSRWHHSSALQKWFRVGAVDLETHRVGYFRFSIDDARAMLRVGLPPAPWDQPQAFGVHVERDAHRTGNKMGRYKVTMILARVPEEVLAAAPKLRGVCERRGLAANAEVGTWGNLVPRVQQQLATAMAALSMTGTFKAADVRAIVGEKVNVSPVLKRLVREGRLTPVGKKKYEVSTPKITPRLDWTG